MPLAIAAHRVLADAEPQVPAGLVGAEVRLALDVGQVRFGQVGGATEQLGQARGQRLDRVLAGVPRRDLRPRLVGLEVGVPAVGQPGRFVRRRSSAAASGCGVA